MPGAAPAPRSSVSRSGFDTWNVRRRAEKAGQDLGARVCRCQLGLLRRRRGVIDAEMKVGGTCMALPVGAHVLTANAHASISL
jgi:hypothetical protein